MALLDLHMMGSSVLRQKSTEVTTFDRKLSRFVNDLFETMHAASGIGLAANQVGITDRVAVVDTGDEPVITQRHVRVME